MSISTSNKRTPPQAPSGNDPRLSFSESELEEASQNAMPSVAKTGGFGDMGMAIGLIGSVGLGLLALMFMNTARTNQTPPTAPTPAVSTPPKTEPSTLPPIDPSVQPLTEPLTLPPQPMPMPAQPMPAPSPTPQQQAEAGGRAPALIIDLSGPGDAPAAASAAAAGNTLLNSNEQFAARLSGDVTQKAARIGQPSEVIAQGTIIPAVLETAINSDLPGYTRAIVSRDVRSFDGKKVLIPRGSRLIGQYKSGLATGETRAFIIWNRLIRPDGMSIQLSSPAIDGMGQAGMSGRVDTHFVKRFGAAILLSVVNGLSSSNSGGNTIVIGTTQQAQSVATDALKNDTNIPPTIKVKQGSEIQVFAARDLDFSLGDRP